VKGLLHLHHQQNCVGKSVPHCKRRPVVELVETDQLGRYFSPVVWNLYNEAGNERRMVQLRPY